MTDTQLRLPMEMLERTISSEIRIGEQIGQHWERWQQQDDTRRGVEIAVKKIERMDRMIYPSSEQGVMI